jgi:uncharacterized protein YceK
MRYAFVIIMGFALSGCVTAATMAGLAASAGGMYASYTEHQKAKTID